MTNIKFTTLKTPLRVEILKARQDYAWKWKPGQFAYVVSYTIEPNLTVDKGPSNDGEIVYGVAKRKDFMTGVYYFSADAIRFTQSPRAMLSGLSDDELVAVDLLLGNGKKLASLPTLVPDPAKRAYVTALVHQLKSLRAR